MRARAGAGAARVAGEAGEADEAARQVVRKISAIEWPFGGLGTEGRVGAPRLRHAKGPVEQRALIAITDPLAEPIGNSAKVAVWK